ncbi:MAG: class I SAM-dependent RNA methyltransferase [Oscillospiraceae bacterium]|jgi:putative N6-adenine-specific DNA methylase|nr:class I SAM-dependent RNA methyltransferase [Oscillospiraceae bacterium]
MKTVMCATCLFGLESILAHEIKRIGAEDIITHDGKVTFSGDFSLLAKANIHLRCAERVLIVLGTFMATSFTELFDNVEKLPFEEYIGRDDAFPVAGWSRWSGLFSVSDCQSIIKRAVVKRLEGVYGQSWFEETGPARQIRFSILKDEVSIMLDTSGAGLHKRGYRRNATEAPIKETLAAGIADLARVRRDSVVIDPMCGSGTLLIESALMGFRIPPGIRRTFAAESWDQIPAGIWKKAREEALGGIARESSFWARGFDTDPEAVRLTGENAGKAGVGKKIAAALEDIKNFPEYTSPYEKAVVLCNPPYGERLLGLKEAEALYRLMGRVFAKRPGYSYYIISPHEEFEALFGRKADKRRKLYNGMIKCQLFMYT